MLLCIFVKVVKNVTSLYMFPSKDLFLFRKNGSFKTHLEINIMFSFFYLVRSKEFFGGREDIINTLFILSKIQL